MQLQKHNLPPFRNRLERPEYYVNEEIHGEVPRHFGYFMTESSGHLSRGVDYCSWKLEALATRKCFRLHGN